MVVTTQSTLAFELIAQKLNVLHGRDGDLSTLTTIEKANLVSAINEVHSLVNSASMIDDTAPSTTSIYSSQKTVEEIAAQIAAALEGEDLSDIAGQITALMQADTGLVSAAAAQSFDAVQQAQARANIAAAAQADLDTANASITANAGNISNNTASIGTNTTDIATNTTNVTANTSAIATNTGNIATNASGVAANAVIHAANAAATAANMASISTLQTDLGDASAFDPVASVNAILTF